MFNRTQFASVQAAQFRDAFLLSLGAALAPGIVRFSYALLLPPMKADLGWTFSQAGAMNTANALGYLFGAVAMMLAGKHCRTQVLFLAGCFASAALMTYGALTVDFDLLLLQRFTSGVSNAVGFIAGGMLAAQLARSSGRAGLILGIYYGGVGWGIVLAALLVRATLGAGQHGWQGSWLALATASAFLSVAAVRAAFRIGGDIRPENQGNHKSVRPWSFWLALLAYGLFGLGYIAYMTFVIAMLRQTGMNTNLAVTFYAVLGVSAASSSFIWAALIDSARGARAFAILCAVLSFATILPAASTSYVVQFLSGIAFGATFMSVVSSTTSFVKKGLPADQWRSAIAAFTVAFAAGQVVGPVIIGHVADHQGLADGFLLSGLVLLAGAVVAALQRPLAGHRPDWTSR
jgi:predicted MFS family arabinose efflux permease